MINLAYGINILRISYEKKPHWNVHYKAFYKVSGFLLLIAHSRWTASLNTIQIRTL